MLEPGAGEDCDSHGLAPGSACGAAGTEHACRYVCESAAACPSGWRCGGDGLCRAAAGALAPPTLLAMSGAGLDVGDFDGDGIIDMVSVGAGSVTVGYGDANEIRSLISVPSGTPDRPAAVSDLDGDGRVDLAVPLQDGVQLFRGDPNRQILPVVLPVDENESRAVRAVPARLEAPFLLDHTLLVSADEEGVRLDVDGRPTDAGALLGLLPPGPVSLPTSFAVRDLDGGGSAEEIVLGFPGQARLVVAGIDCASGTPQVPGECSLTLREDIPLPPGHAVLEDAATRLADFDGDGALDAFVEASGPNGPVLVVARGLQNATPLPGAAASMSCQGCPPGSSSGLRDIADLNGDGMADYISRDGIYVTTGTEPLTLERRFRPNRPWALARAVDLNDDGVLDVVGTGPFPTELLIATGDGLFNRRVIDSASGSIDVVTGDFDGDLRTDLALTKPPGTVWVLFGSEQGPAGPPIVMAELPQVRTITALRSPDSGDGIEDLVVIAPSGAGGPSTFYLLSGAASRRMTSTIPKQGRVYILAAAGAFAAAGETTLVTGEILPGPTSSYFRHDTGVLGGTLVETALLPSEEGCVLPFDFNQSSVAADLDGDDVAELVVLEGWTGLAVSQQESATTWPLTVLRLDGESARCQNQEPLVSEVAPNGMALADLDGDGILDVVAAVDPSAPGPPELKGRGQAGVAVWWGEGDGIFDAPQLYPLEPEGLALHMATLQIDDDDALELVLAHGPDLLRMDLTGRVATTAPLGNKPADLLALVTGDVNGDGLDDVIAGTSSTVFAFSQLACGAADAAAGLCERSEP